MKLNNIYSEKKEESNLLKNDILYSSKHDWDEQQTIIFWKTFRKLIKDQNNSDVLYIKDDMYMFQNIVFPSFDMQSMIKIEINDFELKEDYLFWEKGQNKDFKNLV